MKGCSVLLMLSAIVLCACAAGPALLAQSRTLEPDRAALTAPKLGKGGLLLAKLLKARIIAQRVPKRIKLKVGNG